MQEITTVSQINLYIKNMFVSDYRLRNLKVLGEISNCKYHSSGHIYFTIKDRSSQLSCVMFSSYAHQLDFRMQEGQSVIVEGNISVYERDGKYQLYATAISRAGIGRLYEEYEKLKKRLLAEGLFDEEKKKPVPKYAAKIGVVTSPTGAVIQDICNVAARRNPYVQIILYPARVQGEGAHLEIIEGIRYFEKTDVDTLIIGRGGGSLEDLWEFNQEKLAYAIADCSKPVISAVGHETDTTIADFAADLRVPTPSAAAELSVFSYQEFALALQEYADRLGWQMRNTLQLKNLQLKQYTALLEHLSPSDLLRQRRLYLADCSDKLSRLLTQKLTSAKHQLALYAEELKGLSPLNKLQSGYAYVADQEGNHISSAEKLEQRQQLKLSLIDGQADVTVNKVYLDTKKQHGNEEKYGKKNNFGRIL